MRFVLSFPGEEDRVFTTKAAALKAAKALINNYGGTPVIIDSQSQERVLIPDLP